jgi:hypothetical protein
MQIKHIVRLQALFRGIRARRMVEMLSLTTKVRANEKLIKLIGSKQVLHGG